MPRVFNLASALMGSVMLASLAVPGQASDVNPNLAKLNQIYEMLRQQGKLPTQKLTEAPPDSYAKSDAQQLKDITREEYAKSFPNDEIIDIRIQMDDWERRSEKRWDDARNQYYMVDLSTIQTMVFVKKDGQTAYVYPFDITKDHTNNDALSWDGHSSRSISALTNEISVSMLSQ